MNAVFKPLAFATLNTSTAHSAVMSGSLYDEPTSRAPWRSASRTRPSGVTSVGSTPAVEVAPQHPEGERVRPGEGMEKRLLLGGIALQRGNVSSGRVQGAVLIEAHLADTAPAGFDETAMPAGEAANRSVRQPFDQLALAHPGVEGLGERGGPPVGCSVCEQRDDAAVRHGPAACLPFINIARSARTQPPTRSGPGASWYSSKAVAMSRGDSSRTFGAAYMRSPGSWE